MEGEDECGDEVAEEERGEESGKERHHEGDLGGDPNLIDARVFELLEVLGFVVVVWHAGEATFAVDEFFQRPDELRFRFVDVHLIAEERVGEGEVVFDGIVDDQAKGDDEEEED